jgi:hypothetical protein
MTRKAVVVFTPQGRHWLDWVLHSQFRHCFVVVQDDKGPWILVDPTGGVPTLSIIGLGDFDVVGFYRKMGLTAVEVERPCDPPRWPLTLTTCVGTVKAVLGLRAPLVLTPYALYRRLTDG